MTAPGHVPMETSTRLYPKPCELRACLASRPCSVCGRVLTAEADEQRRLEQDLGGAELLHQRELVACGGCGSSLRDLTLASAIATVTDWPGSLQALLVAGHLRSARVLVIGHVGAFHEDLERFLGPALETQAPEAMHRLPRPSESFDLVIHADVLHRVAQPVQALKECRRVLRPGGIMLMTLPMQADRLSQRHTTSTTPAAASNSHTDPQGAASLGAGSEEEPVPPSGVTGDLPHTRYGADFFLDPIAAGWNSVTVFTLGGGTCFAMICFRH